MTSEDITSRVRHRSRTRSRRALLWWVAAGLCLSALAACVLGLIRVLVPTGPVDLRGNPVAFDDGALPGDGVVKKMDAVADSGARFVVRSVHLNVPLGALSEADATITPPGFTSAYRVRNLGVSLAHADSGTVYVAMHSLRNGAVGPGNSLIDVARGTSTVAPGALIGVGDRTYRVTGWQKIPKTAVPTNAGIWANTPGRLVVLTCLQIPAQTASIDNVVITAALVR